MGLGERKEEGISGRGRRKRGQQGWDLKRSFKKRGGKDDLEIVREGNVKLRTKGNIKTKGRRWNRKKGSVINRAPASNTVRKAARKGAV